MAGPVSGRLPRLGEGPMCAALVTFVIVLAEQLQRCPHPYGFVMIGAPGVNITTAPTCPVCGGRP